MNKTNLRFSAMILAGALLVSSCGNDDDVKPTPSNEPEFPTEFSTKTVEQNKESLEDNGIALINSVNSLKSASGIKTSIAFGSHLDGAGLPASLGGRLNANQGIRIISLLSSFGSGSTSASKTLSGMRSAADEFTSFQQEFNDAVGVYTYSKANDTWTYEKSGDKIVFKFPSTENGTTNNAEYSISDYKGVTISSGLGGDNYTGDYPTGLKAALTVDGTKKMGYEFAAAYNKDGDPESASIAISIDQYMLKYSVVNTVSEAKVDYSLTEGDKNLLSFGLRGAGSFSSEAVQGSEEGTDIVANAGAYFQIMNIKFSGELDATKLRQALESAESAQATAAAWNANYKLLVFYADSKEKIAESEFYSFTETEEYEACDWIWNEGTQDYDVECQTYTEDYDRMEIRMIFADGTKSDLQTYTEVGFSDLQTKLEQFVEDLDGE
jgi:hypothetical protein